MQHTQASVSLVSVLSLAPVWIRLVLAEGWLLPLGLSMLLMCGWLRALQPVDLEEQVAVVSSWSGTEGSTRSLLPGSRNSHQMRNMHGLARGQAGHPPVGSGQ